MKSQGNVLLVSPELEYTGAVTCLKRVSDILIKHGYQVAVWVYRDGPFRKELNSAISVEVLDQFTLKRSEIRKQVSQYDLIVANTAETCVIADLAQDLVPAVCYLHEAGLLPSFLEWDKRRNYSLLRAERIYTVSEYARELLQKNYGKSSVVISNCADDVSEQYGTPSSDTRNNGIIRFLSLGTIEKVKGFDILVDAFAGLDESYRDQCELHIAGRLADWARDYHESLLQRISSFPNIFYHGELRERSAIFQLIRQSDVMVIPSRDDACPLVAFEGAMMQKPLIVSQNVGAKYLVTNDSGWIVETGNIQALRAVFREVIDHPEGLHAKGLQSRANYLSTSTYEVYEQNVLQMVKDNLLKNRQLYRFVHTPKRWWLDIRRRKEEADAMERRAKAANDLELWNNELFRFAEDQKKYIAQLEQKLNIEPMLFPYDRIPKGSRIILYGAGQVGRDYYQQIQKTGYCEQVLWIDTHFEKYAAEDLPIFGPDMVTAVNLDYALIAVLDEKAADHIEKLLCEKGIPTSKIIRAAQYF